MKGGDDEGMKDSFVVHTSFYEPIKGLSDKQLGQLFRMLFEYQMGNKVQADDDMGMATNSDYQELNEMTQYAKVAATSYIRDFDIIRKQERNWLIVFGQSGSGKTMLGRAIVKALIERQRPVRARAVKYYEMMQILKAKSNAEDYWQILDRYTDCELLFIDDLLKEKSTCGELTEADIGTMQ